MTIFSTINPHWSFKFLEDVDLQDLIFNLIIIYHKIMSLCKKFKCRYIPSQRESNVKYKYQK
jgi:hypothetical protein